MVISNNNSGFARHPGHMLHRELTANNMTQAEFAVRAGIAEKTISQIVNGVAPISPEMAFKLEYVLGTPARVWLTLQTNYEESLQREIEFHKVQEEQEIASRFNYNSLRKLYAQLRDKVSVEEKVIELRRFFGVANLSNIFETDSARPYLSAALRTGTEASKKIPDKFALAAWLRTGELYAANIQCPIYDPHKLKSALVDLKQIIFNCTIPDAWSQICKLLNECGVKIVAVPYLSKTYVNGAVRWIGDNPVIIMSDRNAYADIFWFSLLHEICHILKHGKKYACIAFEDSIKCYERRKEEYEADDFAANYFIRNDVFEKFANSYNCWDGDSIRSFADQHGVPYYMVVGRLCHKKGSGWSRPIATNRPKIRIIPQS